MEDDANIPQLPVLLFTDDHLKDSWNEAELRKNQQDDERSSSPALRQCELSDHSIAELT